VGRGEAKTPSPDHPLDTKRRTDIVRPYNGEILDGMPYPSDDTVVDRDNELCYNGRTIGCHICHNYPIDKAAIYRAGVWQRDIVEISVKNTQG